MLVFFYGELNQPTLFEGFAQLVNAIAKTRFGSGKRDVANRGNLVKLTTSIDSQSDHFALLIG